MSTPIQLKNPLIIYAAVISRQFREMSKARIESLLASFPKLIPTNIQHTSVETEDVRYVYQPLEDLYILLITNKASNILQDIETLHLFARVVSDMCRTAEQREILKNAFELLEAFDEIVSQGYREQVNLMQVRSVLEMESHEEKIQDIIARVSAIDLLAWWSPIRLNRTKKRRRKRSSSAARNNSRCSAGNNKDALRLGARRAVAILVEESPVTHQFLNVTIHLSPPSAPPHRPLLRSVRLHSKAAA